jgi:hypothetical protein
MQGTRASQGPGLPLEETVTVLFTPRRSLLTGPTQLSAGWRNTIPMCHPQVIRSRNLMRHDGGNRLKSQDHREGPGALPLNSMECEYFDHTATSSSARTPSAMAKRSLTAGPPARSPRPAPARPAMGRTRGRRSAADPRPRRPGAGPAGRRRGGAPRGDVGGRGCAGGVG